MTKPGLSLKARTILVVTGSLLLFHTASLGLYIFLSALTVTLEREEQIANRIVTATHLIEQAGEEDRLRFALQLSDERFSVSLDSTPLDRLDQAESGAEITQLISERFSPLQHVVKADYVFPENNAPTREITTQRSSGPFRIHEALIVSIDIPDAQADRWLNFRISGSAWDHIIAPAAIPSLTLMAVAIIIFGAWAVSQPLNSLKRFAQASDAMGKDVEGAAPLDETGPMEVWRVARAFNTMQLRVQRLLVARNDMLAAISHDFRTPLTRLRLRVEQIPEKVQREKAIKDIEEMDALMQFTLAFAKDQAVTQSKKQTDIAELIRSVQQQREDDQDRIELRQPDSISIACEPINLRRVIANLIDNGLHYASHVRISTAIEDDQLIIDVDDNGPGVEPTERLKVLDPFYRVDSSRGRNTGGSGLGLSIAQTIVQAHGGTLALHDSPLGGLKVRVQLPIE